MRFISQTEIRGGRRFEFVARTGQYVLVDIGPAQREEWVSQFPGEPRWYPFEPTDEERVEFSRSRLQSDQFVTRR